MCVLACESTPQDAAWLGLSPGESDDGNAELGIGDDGETDTGGTDEGGETDTGEEPGSGALRIVLGGDGSPFIDALNTYAGGSYDGLVVSIHIDPATSHYEWMRYHGGLKNEVVRDLDIDKNGRICGSGWTNSTDLPLTANAPQIKNGGGTRDLFVGCWSAQGDLSYATYLGGSSAELNETALTISGDETLVVTGSTNSVNLKTTAGAVQTVPPAGYNGLAFTYGASGAIAWGTYLGGSGIDSVGLDNDVGPDGDIWMIGSSTSNDFPVTDGSVFAGVEDSAIARLSSDGTTLELATLHGGSAGDYGRVIAALPDGTAITCTNTYSEDFPVSGGVVQSTHASQAGGANFDLALSHLDSDGSILAATYLGSTGFDACLFLDVDAEGNVYVSGWTDNLPGFPLTTDVSAFGPWDPDYQQGFLVKLDPDFEAVEYAVRTTVTRAMDVLDDGRVVLLAPEDPGVAVTPNAIPGESGNLLVVYEPDGVTHQYVGYVMGEGMFVEVLKAVELP